MGLWSDLKILAQMAFKPVRGGSHAERMESFYGGQAKGYDDFRRRLLKGREELWAALPKPEGGVWVDLGGGTGANLENFGPEISRLKQVYVVDLSSSLLAVARDRCRARGWTNVECVQADATTFRPPEGQADVVTFSYSLTMIPPWYDAIENALAMLKHGGRVGVVDFYVSQKHPAAGLRRHGWVCRSLWPVWFATDNVFPSADHLPFLQRRFETMLLEERLAKLPYVPLLRAPYYFFVGRKA